MRLLSSGGKNLKLNLSPIIGLLRYPCPLVIRFQTTYNVLGVTRRSDCLFTPC